MIYYTLQELCIAPADEYQLINLSSDVLNFTFLSIQPYFLITVASQHPVSLLQPFREFSHTLITMITHEEPTEPTEETQVRINKDRGGTPLRLTTTDRQIKAVRFGWCVSPNL